VFPAGPRGDLDHSIVGIVEPDEQVDRRMRGSEFRGATSHGHLRIAQGGSEHVIAQFVQPFERTEGCGAHRRIRRRQTRAGDLDLAGVSGDRDIA
jgi:hypothetical protein